MQSEKQLASASDAQGGAADCVQVMSIHKSKGLEYPVCFLVDTAREFNMMDLKEPILMDSEAYVGVKPYINYARRSTFPYTAIRMRKKRESIDEEMRMLYVALTRAQGRGKGRLRGEVDARVAAALRGGQSLDGRRICRRPRGRERYQLDFT